MISEKRAAAIADAIEHDELEWGEPLPEEEWPEFARGRGRPSLGAGRSPQVTVRLPAALRERAEARARSEGVSLSGLTREALEAYLADSA